MVAQHFQSYEDSNRDGKAVCNLWNGHQYYIVVIRPDSNKKDYAILTVKDKESRKVTLRRKISILTTLSIEQLPDYRKNNVLLITTADGKIIRYKLFFAKKKVSMISYEVYKNRG